VKEKKNIVHTHTHRRAYVRTNTSRGGGTWGLTTTTIAIRRMGRVYRAAIYVCVAVPVAEPRLLCVGECCVCACLSLSPWLRVSSITRIVVVVVVVAAVAAAPRFRARRASLRPF